MPRYKVTLERLCTPVPPTRERNPFFVRDIWNFEPRRVLLREWEMEAKDEAEVKRFLGEAREQNLVNVRGFTLRSIEKTTEATLSRSLGATVHTRARQKRLASGTQGSLAVAPEAPPTRRQGEAGKD